MSLETFVSSMETRPLDKLVSDLPNLARTASLEFSLARKILRRRIRELAPVEQERLRIFADEVLSSADDEAKERIRSVFVPHATA